MPDDHPDPSFERLLRRVVPWPADEHLTLDLDPYDVCALVDLFGEAEEA